MTPHPNQSIEETEELKCEDCDPKDEHIIPEDKSTTRISRPCVGCGKHQTIAGALLKSNYWNEWYKHASKNMLFDVDETLTVDAMSDAHFDSFINFILDSRTPEERASEPKSTMTAASRMTLREEFLNKFGRIHGDEMPPSLRKLLQMEKGKLYDNKFLTPMMDDIADWWIEKVKKLLTEEMKICREEGTPTSRLTAIWNRLSILTKD